MSQTQGRDTSALKLFISYSRRDAAFADRLQASLEALGFKVTIDRRDLPKLEDWQRELLGLIQQADTVLFVVSPHSLASPVCNWEIEQVKAYRKRLAPLLIADTAGAALPEGIASINYLSFVDETQYDAALGELSRALRTDVTWIKEHTRLDEAARYWLDRDSPDRLLLQGREYEDAEQWLLDRPAGAPQFTQSQRLLLAASRASLRKFEASGARRAAILDVFLYCLLLPLASFLGPLFIQPSPSYLDHAPLHIKSLPLLLSVCVLILLIRKWQAFRRYQRLGLSLTIVASYALCSPFMATVFDGWSTWIDANKVGSFLVSIGALALLPPRRVEWVDLGR